MSRFDRQIASAKRQIKKDGQSVIWRVVKNGEPENPSKPWKPSPSISIDYPVTIAFFPVPRYEKKENQYKIGTEIPTGFVEGYMASVPFKPSIKDVVIRNEVELTLIGFEEIAPNGQPILYILEFGS